MKTTRNLTVTQEHVPPAGTDACVHCRQKVGTPHTHECVMVMKRVKVRAVIEYEVEVPYHWDVAEIEFHRNEGSWCASNLVDELKEYEQYLARQDTDNEGACLCPFTHFHFDGVVDPGPYVEDRGSVQEEKET